MAKVKKPKFINPIEKHFSNVSRYHYYMFFILFASKLPIFWHVLNLIFLSPPMDYHCDKSDNSTMNVCPCDDPVWDKSVFEETMQSKFGILCDSKWLISFSQSINYVGMLLGAFILGFLSDKYGRLLMYTISCLILAVFGCLVSAMPTAASFTLMRCLEGIGAGGAIVTAYVLCVEYCSVTDREIITALFHIPINLGHLTIPLVSYLLRHCDEFQLALSIPIFLFVPTYWILMESPKWLMDNGQTDKAIAVMEKFGNFNGRPCENIREELEAYAAQKDKSRVQIKFWQIFRHKKLSLNLACMSLIYFLCGLGYYGVSQYIGKMSGNIHINVGLSGLLLLPGTLSSIFLLKLLPRRLFLMVTIFLSGILMMIVICIPSRFNLTRVVITCFCNCFFFMAFIIAFLYSVELFPTTVRNSVLGFLSVISRLGQIVAPQVNAFSETVSGVVYGVMALLGTIICLILPETKNVELPSSVDDSKSIPRKTRHLVEDDSRGVQIDTANTNETAV